MAAEGEGSASSSAHSSSWNPVESGTSSPCLSDSEGTESSAQYLLQRLCAPQPSDLARERALRAFENNRCNREQRIMPRIIGEFLVHT